MNINFFGILAFSLINTCLLGTAISPDISPDIKHQLQENFNYNTKKAILSKDLKLAQSIIKYNSYISTEDKNVLLNNKTNIIHLAAYFNIPDIFDLSSDINKKGLNNITPLDLAIKNNSCEVVEKLLLDSLNKTQVLRILRNIKKLNPSLAYNLNINLSLISHQDQEVKLEVLDILKTFSPTLALVFALILLDAESILEVLNSDLDFDINAQNDLGITPLMYALENTTGEVNEEIVLKILDLNPDINIQDINGTTPFMIALRNKTGIVTERILRKMLDLDPDVNIQDINGTTALMHALRNKSGIISENIMLELIKPSINLVVMPEIRRQLLQLANNYQSDTVFIILSLRLNKLSS